MGENVGRMRNGLQDKDAFEAWRNVVRLPLRFA